MTNCKRRMTPFLMKNNQKQCDQMFNHNTLNIHLNLNTVTAAFFYSYQLTENPSIPVNLRSNSGFDLDLNIFNELRIGVGYKLSRE